MRTRVWWLALCVLVAAIGACWAAPRVNREFTLPAIEGRSFRPRISGDWIVAIHNTKDNKQQLGVIVYNIPGANVYTIFPDKPSNWPSISGNLVIWSGMSDRVESLRGTRGSRGRLPSSMMLFDLISGRCFCPELRTVSAFSVSISGDNVAYELGSRIYLLNPKTGLQRRVSEDQPNYQNPDIGGDLIVWEEFTNPKARSNDRRIKGYRISTGELINIADSGGTDRWGPRTDGRTVVWTTKSGADIYDAATGRLTTVPKAFFPDVDNGIVVYLKPAVTQPGGKCMCGKSSVYGRDLGTNGEFRISKDTADQGPSIDNSRVIWCSGDKLYCAELTLKGH